MGGSAALSLAEAGAPRTGEAQRAFTQRRLALFLLLTWCGFVTLLALMNVAYAVYPQLRPLHATAINLYGAAGLTVIAATWLVARSPRALRAEVLAFLELLAMVLIAAAFTASGVLSEDHPVNVYSAFIWLSFVVFSRAMIIPSSAPRAAILSSIAMLPMLGMTAVVDLGIPRPALMAGTGIFCGVVIALSTVGAQVIYGLRTQVAEAMQLGQYTLLEKIGEGGMGTVYRARHALLRRPTAIKLLRPDRNNAEHLARFEREARHTAELSHPNTVAIYDYGRSPDGVFYYVMEYLDGVDLQTLTDLDGPQPWRRVLHILEQVAGALVEAHGRGLVHRDVKPRNIILCRRGGVADVAKVVDFGLVRELDAEPGLSHDHVVGTPDYLAPESINDPSSTGPASDLYALGAVAYYLLTGQRVFEGDLVQLCVQHLRDTPVPPEERTDNPVPPALSELILACLAKGPDARPTADHLRRAVARLAAGERWTEQEAGDWWLRVEPSLLRARAGTTGLQTSITIDLAARSST